MKLLRHSPRSLHLLVMILSILSATLLSTGCGGELLTKSPRGVTGTTEEKGEEDGGKVVKINEIETVDTSTGVVTRRTCQVAEDCPEGTTCEGGKCYKEGDRCAQITCGELERCEHGTGEMAEALFCVPNCKAELQCGGKCSAMSGQVCVDYQWVAPCSDGRDHCATKGGTICCGEGTSCVGNACVTLGRECDPDNGVYCKTSEYCDPGTNRCIKYADNNGLCLYKPVDVDKAAESLHWHNKHGSVYTTPLVADLDGDKIPEIIFLDYNIGIQFDAKLVTIRSTKGNPPEVTIPFWSKEGYGDHFDPSNPKALEYLYSDVVPAVADLDGDGRPEIVVLVNGPRGPQSEIKAFHADGSSYFQKQLPADQYHADAGAIAIGDINHDGKPEIVALGHVFDYRGELLATLDFDKSKLTDGKGGRWSSFDSSNNFISDVPLLADVNLDGYLDIVDGLMVFLYKPDQSTADRFVFEQPTLEAGGSEKAERPYSTYSTDGGKQGAVSAVANFAGPASSYPQIVTLFNNTLYLADWRGKVLSQAALPVSDPSKSSEGSPTIADFDDDGEPEIGVTYSDGYAVYDVIQENGSLKLKFRWKFESEVASDEITGSSVFDFDGDGAVEIIMVDQKNLYILSDKERPDPDNPGVMTHKLSAFPNPNGSVWGASLEPVVADIDADGHADIIVSSRNGVRAFSNPGNNWVPTRPVWNQHAYSVTNIETNGSVPIHQQKNWQIPWLNNFRQNIQEGNPFVAPDLAIKVEPVFSGACDGRPVDHLDLNFSVRNIGSAPAHAGKVPVVLEAVQGGKPLELGRFKNEGELPPNGKETFNYRLPLPPLGLNAGEPFDLIFAVDPEGNIKECDKENNSIEIKRVMASAPDLVVGLRVDDPFECLSKDAVHIQVKVSNTMSGTIPAGSAKVALYATVGSEERLKLGEMVVDKDIPAGESVEQTFTWSRFGREKINRLIKLEAVVDEKEEITECVETNNTVSYLFTCQQLG